MKQTKQHSASVPCPVCHAQMTVRELECPSCQVTVRGDFGVGSEAVPASRFQRLTPDQTVFLETFLSCRGIIKDVEAALGISYPTVRARLDSVLAALGLSGGVVESVVRPETAASTQAPAPVERPSLKDILTKLDSGAIDAQSALDAIRGDNTKQS